MSGHDDLAGRTVVVLGATGGVGLGLVRSLLQRGAGVVAVGRSEQRLTDLTHRFVGVGSGDLQWYVADVAAEDPGAVAAGLRRRFGAVDGAVIAVGDPGRPGRGGVLGLTDDELLAMVHGNELLGLHALQALVPVVSPGGAVVNLLGFSSEIAFPGHPLMGSTNAAVRSLLLSLAAELNSSGPRVYGLVLGVVRTEARQQAGIDHPDWLTGEEVGDRVADLIVGTSTTVIHHLLEPVSEAVLGRATRSAPR